MEEISTCKVDLMLDSKSVYAYRKDFNEAELKAIKISQQIYANDRYYNIENIVFNYERETLEIHIKK